VPPALQSAMSSSSPHSSTSPPQSTPKNTDSNATASDANIRNFAPVARIMKMALPDNAKIAKEAKECMQECVSEFISFITSEGESTPSHLPASTNAVPLASEKCQQEKRKTVNGEDILFAMTSLGFENYSEALKIYLSRYREVSLTPSLSLLPSHLLP
jgi:nuclear transcription Y subunit beta